MPFAAAILCLALVPLPPDEFHERCAALSSPAALERAAAERWLAAHLTPEHQPELVALAHGADAEVRARLVRILAADPRHLELALALAGEPSAELSELGAEAVRATLAVLEPRLGEPARRGPELRTTIERLSSSSWPRLLVLESAGPLGEAALALEFAGVLEVGLALDPALATRVPKGASELHVGPWEESLDAFLRAYGLFVEGHALPRGREADTRTSGFLRVFAGENERVRSGAEHVGDWLLLVARPGDETVRAQAARNLAATGLGPVLEWLGRRAAAGDAAALEGVLLAGARGRLAGALQEDELHARLLAEAARGGPRAALALGTLAALPDSEARRQQRHALLGGTAAEQWIALHVAERAGGADAPALAHARLVLADARAPALLRLQALYTFARLAPAGEAAPAVAEALALVRAAPDAGERARLARTLAAVRVEPPARDPAEFARTESGFEPAPRLGLLEAWLWNGDAAVVGAHLADWVRAAGAEEPRLSALLAEVLAAVSARGQGALLRRALAEGRRLVPDAARALERLELLLGLVPAEDVAALLARGGWLLSGPSADLALLGALAGYPQPIAAEGPAREVLHGALALALAGVPTRSESAELLDALARAAGGLYSAGRDEEGDAFSARVRTAVRRGPKGVLRRRVELGLWPPTPLLSTRDVAAELAARTLPAGL